MSAFVALTSRCNNRCLFCYERAPDDTPPAAAELGRDAIARELRHAASISQRLVLTGGEPTLSSELPWALARAREEGLRERVLATNGRRLAYRAYAAALHRAGLTHAHVSLHGHSPEVHDALTRTPSSFEQTCAGVRNLCAEGVHVTCSVVLNQRNATTLGRLLEFIDSLGVHDISLMGLKPFGGAFRHWARVAFAAREVGNVVNGAIAQALARGMRLKTTGLDPDLFDSRGTETDDRRALDYFERVTLTLGAPPYCASLCDQCFGRGVCVHGSQTHPLGRMICKCNRVHAVTLRNVLSSGARTVTELLATTRAGSACGRCLPELDQLCAQPTEPSSAVFSQDSEVDSPPRRRGFASRIEVPPRCRGPQDFPTCQLARGTYVYPEVACGQRCVFGDAPSGSAGWMAALGGLADRHLEPIYVVGADAPTVLRLRDHFDPSTIRVDLTAAVMILCTGAADPVSRSARRDARKATRAGLVLSIERDASAVEELYELYSNQCRALGATALPRSFIEAERDEDPEGFSILFARAPGGAAAAGRLVRRQSNLLRIIDGGWRRDCSHLLPEVFLHVQLIDWARDSGVEVIDAGVAEASNLGWRDFKHRLGFMEVGAVVAVTQTPGARASEPRAGRIAIALGKRCNQDCRFCYRETDVEELDTAAVELRIREASRTRHSGIALSGGEPTLREDLPELIRYARTRGLGDVQLHTNGVRLADPSYVAELLAAGLGSTMISLHSHRPEVFRTITGRDHHARVVRGLRNLLAGGRPTIVSHVVCSHNYRDLPEFANWLAEEFAGVELFFFFAYPSARSEQNPDIVPRLPDVEPYWYEALRILEGRGVRYTVDCLAGLPPCYMRGFEHAAKILWMSALRQQIGAEADDHLIKMTEMRKAPQCGDCAYDGACLGFWRKYLDRYGDGDLRPVRSASAGGRP